MLFGRYTIKKYRLKIPVAFLLLLMVATSYAQPEHEKEGLLKKLSFTDQVPEGLLARRSVVLFDDAIPLKELEEIQLGFQPAGIDAIAYFPVNRMLSGADPQKAFADYLVGRNVGFLIFVERTITNYTFTFVPFNNKPTLADVHTPAWRQTGSILKEVLLTIYRLALSNQKKQNFLVNDFPEFDIPIKIFTGRRNEGYTGQVKTLRVAVPKFANEKADAAMEQILKKDFPVKYELVDPELTEAELSRSGFGLVIRYVHTSGRLAKELLDYDVSQIANSISYVAMVGGEAQLKTIPADEIVYKFYVKHLEYGNIFLGNKWDADPSWEMALTNHLLLMRQDLKY